MRTLTGSPRGLVAPRMGAGSTVTVTLERSAGRTPGNRDDHCVLVARQEFGQGLESVAEPDGLAGGEAEGVGRCHAAVPEGVQDSAVRRGGGHDLQLR